ncbi:hypothetical protein L2E68_19535 [Planktothrix agardhii 1029]|jgi:transposase|uniref:hypothetical protein n=1 Tax=Planktothrix agardhii TaxID=1160 RepID=UPI000484ADAB|nr:hypothetical protein [Planktothrix agardhii]MCF3618866.1 hypothetical protein [Planktothrix agardhii 1030]MCB8762361.1 hypothetical protein [Planktothrix agardhii 1809]MCF3573428.1 hypothetical protein [Planktothrix agardhii 1805]MCF3577486.1 hypothetical protein [Planktothrix agardhii 1812]MCF3577604.1 hypothetical protein [Planktothrix agardhii 1812]
MKRDAGTFKWGSFKLIKHRNKWYAYLSITEDVPEVETEKRLGCDRGQNNLCNGFIRFKLWGVWRTPELGEKQ